MYKLAHLSDKEHIKALWAYAFDEQEPFLSEYFDKFWKTKNALVIKKNEHLVASLQMIPYQVNLRGTLLPSSYIVGVSVAPEFRGQKFSTALMRDCLIEQKRRGQALSLLIPFSYEFYKKLGYRLCYTHSLYEIGTRNIPLCKEDCTLRKMNFSDYPELNSVYEDFCSDKNGYIIRNKHDWEYIFFEHRLFDGYVYGVYKHDKIMGYVSYTKKHGEIYVRELVYTNRDSLYCLLRFITSHFSGNENIKIRTANNNILLNILKEPKNTLTVKPTVMARIVDIPAVLSSVNIGTLKISVYDDLIEENCGIYEKVNGSVIKTNNCKIDASMNIGTLTQLVMGFCSAEELHFLGLIKAEKRVIKRLDKIFPKQNNYINHIMEE